MMRYYILFATFLMATSAISQLKIPLYSGSIPNNKNVPDKAVYTLDENVGALVEKVSVPYLTVFKPRKQRSTRMAVIICPGGGYHVELISREGDDVAKKFAQAGITAFVLQYRLPDSSSMIDPSKAPLQDAQQAIKIVRQGAGKWNLDTNKIGIMGFSAGGHLAASAGIHFDTSFIDNSEHINLRPDFMILIYPVISFNDSLGHTGSRTNLLGTASDPNQIVFYSNELHVNKNTPPAFLTHAADDTVVPPANSLVFYNRLRENGVSAELHMYARGEHGYLKYPTFKEWFGRCVNWVVSQ